VNKDFTEKNGVWQKSTENDELVRPRTCRQLDRQDNRQCNQLEKAREKAKRLPKVGQKEFVVKNSECLFEFSVFRDRPKSSSELENATVVKDFTRRDTKETVVISR
jgi:hypothetical protein